MRDGDDGRDGDLSYERVYRHRRHNRHMKGGMQPGNLLRTGNGNGKN
ncbi:MAG: hypothetical protein IKF49_06335 [Clostridia bacterium]|nr:hypothetical protein [Clostridia bacterium]